jgi:hypothetical protein
MMYMPIKLFTINFFANSNQIGYSWHRLPGKV